MPQILHLHFPFTLTCHPSHHSSSSFFLNSTLSQPPFHFTIHLRQFLTSSSPSTSLHSTALIIIIATSHSLHLHHMSLCVCWWHWLWNSSINIKINITPLNTFFSSLFFFLGVDFRQKFSFHPFVQSPFVYISYTIASREKRKERDGGDMRGCGEERDSRVKATSQPTGTTFSSPNLPPRRRRDAKEDAQIKRRLRKRERESIDPQEYVGWS